MASGERRAKVSSPGGPLLAACVLAAWSIRPLQGLSACSMNAGYATDCSTDQHCWQLNPSDGVETAQECQQRCKDFSECRYFSFHRTFGLKCFLLGPDARFTSPMPRVISGDRLCNIPERPPLCHVSKGYIDPLAPASLEVASAGECKDACENSTSCSHFSYNVYLKTCHFPAANATYYPWLVGVVSGKRGCEMPMTAVSCKVGFMYVDGSIPLPPERGVLNETACQEACQQEPSCKYFAFSKVMQQCWIMGSQAHLVPSFLLTNAEGIISGERDCMMSPFCDRRIGSYVDDPIHIPPERNSHIFTASDCREACRDAVDCAYFSFGINTRLCELSGAHAHFTVNQYYESGSRECELYSNEDSYCLEDAGAFVDFPHVLSVPNGPEGSDGLTCQRACQNSTECAYFTFSIETKECWLLGKNAYLSSGLVGYYSGLADCKLPQKGDCLVDQGYTHPGTPEPNFGASSPLGCLMACKQDSACRYFTFNTLSKACWLLGADAIFMKDLPGVVSGERNCESVERPSRSLISLVGAFRVFFPQLATLLKDEVSGLTATHCPLGMANPWNAMRCEGCPNGSTRRRGGATRCIPCPQGTYNVGGRDDCEDNDEVILRAAGEGNATLVGLLRDLGTDVGLALSRSARAGDALGAKILVGAGADGRSVFEAAAVNASSNCSSGRSESCDGEMEAMRTLWPIIGDDVGDDDAYLVRILEGAVYAGAQPVVEQLLGWGVDADLLDSHGRTPIFTAAERGDLVDSEKLLESGAWVDREDKHKDTPIDVAELSGHDEEAALLRLHTRSYGETLRDPLSWVTAAASLWCACICYLVCSGCAGGGKLESESEADSSDESGGSSSSGDESRCKTDEDSALETGLEGHSARLLRVAGPSRAAELMAAEACMPTLMGTAVKGMRLLGVMAKLLFPVNFCGRYVVWWAWLPILALVYIVPCILSLGLRETLRRPAVALFGAPHCNFLGFHRCKRSSLFSELTSAVWPALLFPLAVALGGPRFRGIYDTAADNTAGLISLFYRFCSLVEGAVPSLGEASPLRSDTFDPESDPLSYERWFALKESHAFPFKLCPMYKTVLARCVFDTHFDMYKGMIISFGVIGLMTYAWCVLAVVCVVAERRQRDEGAHAGCREAVQELAVEIDRRSDPEAIARLHPHADDLPEAARGVLRRAVAPATKSGVYLAAALLLLDFASDVNVQVTLLVSRSYISAGFMMWVTWVSLFVEIFLGGIRHLRGDAEETVKTGIKVERQLQIADVESGFEACASLFVMVVGLWSALGTPWQFITGMLSLLSSMNGLSGYVFRQADLALA